MVSMLGHVMRVLKCTLDLTESHGKTWLELGAMPSACQGKRCFTNRKSTHIFSDINVP